MRVELNSSLLTWQRPCAQVRPYLTAPGKSKTKKDKKKKKEAGEGGEQKTDTWAILK